MTDYSPEELARLVAEARRRVQHLIDRERAAEGDRTNLYNLVLR